MRHRRCLWRGCSHKASAAGGEVQREASLTALGTRLRSTTEGSPAVPQKTRNSSNSRQWWKPSCSLDHVDEGGEQPLPQGLGTGRASMAVSTEVPGSWPALCVTPGTPVLTEPSLVSVSF